MARARSCILRQQRLASLSNIENDRSRFEKHEAVFLESRHLPERLQRPIILLILIALFEQPGPVWQACLLQRPARAEVAHLAASKVWNPLEGGNRDHAQCSFAMLAI